MRGIIALCFLCLVAEGCGTTSPVADCYSVGRSKKLSQTAIDLYVMHVKSENGSRLDLYGQMPFTRLHFIKTGTLYTAAYTVLFLFRDKEGEPVQSREISRTVSAGSYDATVSPACDAFLQSVTLPPGQYMLECSTIEQNSLVRSTQRTEVSAPDYSSDSVLTSSILLLLKTHADEKGTVLHPLFPQTIQFARDSLGVFQEIYGARPGDSIVIGMTYRTLTAASRRVSRSDVTMVPPYARYVGSCRHGLDSVALDARSLQIGTAGTVTSILFYPVPPAGYSEIERTVTVYHHGLTTSHSSRMQLFRIDADSLIDADVVDAMRYIAHDDEFDSLKTLPDSLRSGVAARFWERHGGAARRAEFEQRVNGANKLFSVCMNGSRTPMGITYIVCGPPDYVECRTPSTETWYYTVGSVTMPVEFRLERRDEVVSYYELMNNSIDGLLWMTFVDQWRR